MKLRNDILVLRGYSIIIITLYHCNIIVTGYNAVIIFIVISGYLSKQKGGFYILWKRYIRLIFPSLTNVILFLILYNKEIDEENLINIYSELYANILIYANYFFIYSSTDYFNPPDSSFLLNYWYISVDIHLHIIYFINSKNIYIMLFFIAIPSIVIYFITFINYKSYNYFSSIPRAWQFFFSKVFIINYSMNKLKITSIIILISIVVYDKEIIDERFYQQLIVIATYIYLSSSINIRCWLLEKVGVISYFIYLVHYPVFKIEGMTCSFALIVFIYSFILLIIYGVNVYERIKNNKLIFAILMIIEIYGLMHYATIIISNNIATNKSKTFFVKKLNRNNYCCYRSINNHHQKTILFIGDSHMFNLLGNFYNILIEYQYIIFYKYIHTEFIVRNNSNLYDISDNFNLIVNMNLFFDNKHIEYLEYYPKNIISYLNYLKQKAKYIIYFKPTPVLKKKLSCKKQKIYVAQNGLDILIYTKELPNMTNIIVFDITSLFCNNDLCNLNYKNICIYSDEHHFTHNFYKAVINYTTEIIKPYLNNLPVTKKRIDTCDYILYKNKILRAWKFTLKECKLYYYY